MFDITDRRERLAKRRAFGSPCVFGREQLGFVRLLGCVVMGFLRQIGSCEQRKEC